MTTMNPRDQISVNQLQYLLSASIISVGFLDIYGIAKDITINAWIPILIAVMLSPVFIWVNLRLAEQFPGKTILDYLPDLLGKWLGFFLGFFLNLYYFAVSAIAFRLVLDIVKVYLLPNTPLEFIILVGLTVIFYTSWFDVNSVARVSEVMIPLSTFFFLVLLLISQKATDYSNLLPIAENGLIPIFKKISFALPHFLGMGIITFLYPFLNHKKNVKKPLFISLGFTGTIIILLNLSVVAVFGEEIKDLYFPSISLFQRVNITVMFMERLVFFLLVIIFPVFFIFVLTSFFISSVGFTSLFKLREHNVFTILLVPVYFLIINLPASIADLFIVREWARWVSIFVMIIPFFLLLITTRKKRRIDHEK